MTAVSALRRWRRARLWATLATLPAIGGYAATIAFDNEVGNLAGLVGLIATLFGVSWAAYTAGDAACAMRSCQECKNREERHWNQ